MVTSAQLIHGSQKEAWKLYPEVIKRIRDFCVIYDSMIDVASFDEFLRMSFVSAKPTALIVAGLDDDGFVCGHLVAVSERWFNKPVVTILQLEADDRISPAVWQEVLQSLKLFAAAHGAEQFQLAARNEAVARLFRRYGFKNDKILMRMPVEGWAGKAADSLG